MNKRIKTLIVLTLITMMTSQTTLLKLSNNVKAANLNIQASYKVQDGNSLGGFELVSKKWAEGLKSNICIYKHAKSGAQLIYLQNDSEEKTMCINFRTPTKDNTGVNHIIEHSVLCGSQKYPVNELFNQMAKQSLSTFLNAETGDDITMYPVASRNDKDFENLISVYLDSVFYPNVLKDKRIFEQEGIRYELNSPEDELKYNGVVYNEMKGNYSTPNAILNRAVYQSLFPDTSYKYESGGLPEEIPNLTYDELIKTYKENYAPSNSYFYLYGKMNIEKILKFIGDNYLNNFDKKEINTSIELQKPFEKSVEKTVEYSIPKGTPTENKTYLTLNYVIDKNTNKDLMEEILYLKVLLGGIPSSPITKALKENGFGEQVSVSFGINNAQPVLTIEVANVDENKKEQFKKVVNETLQNIVEKGFDNELLNSISNVYDLSQRMNKGNYALDCNNMIMASWIHGGEPDAYLNIESDMKNVKIKENSAHLQEIVKKYLLENNHSALVILKPSAGLEEQKETELKNKLTKYKESLSKQQIKDLVKNTQEFQKWQNTPPTEEQISSLPSLNLKDLNSKVEEYKTIEKNENGIKVLEHPIYTNEVDYTNLYFDTTKVPQDKLGYIYLLSSVLGNVDTQKYSKEKLVEQVLINSGGIAVKPMCFINNSDSNLYFPKICVNSIGLSENLSKCFELINEIIFNSNLNDKERLKTIIRDLKTKEEQFIAYNGGNLAISKALSYMSNSGKYNGYLYDEFYSFLCDLDANFDKKSDDIVKNLQQVRDLIFNKNNMIASYTGSEENYQSFSNNFKNFSTKLRTEQLPHYSYTFDNSKNNEGLIIPSEVQYVVKGGDLRKAGTAQNGKIKVLQNILQSDYLWNNIRIKGGAYGAYMNVENSNVLLYSYRDPNLKETIDTFNAIPHYLSNFNADEKQMTNYIIGAIGKEDKLNQTDNPFDYSNKADELYLTDTSQAELQKNRNEMISTTAEDVKSFAPVMDSVLKQNHFCVVGGEEKIEENKDSFSSIKNVLPAEDEVGEVLDRENKDGVDVNKVWKIKYIKAISPLTVYAENVYVLDSNNHKVKVNVSYDKNNNNINITPINAYIKNKKYTLVVKNIKSLDQNGREYKLLPDINMDFTIKK